MKLPNLDEARKRTKSEIEFITLDQITMQIHSKIKNIF